MHLPADGCEYAHWPITNAPDGLSFQVQFLPTTGLPTAWLDAETVSAAEVRVLLAGADCTSPSAGATVLAMGRWQATLRCTDAPEIVIRDGGFIDVT